MADLLWRVGAFAERYPRIAAELGRAHALSSRAMAMLHATAGTAAEDAIRYPHPCAPTSCDAPPATCCEPGCGRDQGSCCAMGCCSRCGPEPDGVEMVYPAQDAAVDNAHAFEAALRDIDADLEVEDVPGAKTQAFELYDSGDLAEHYVPRRPARELPDGGEPPAICPICGCKACPACHCTCECCDYAVEPEGAPAAA